jgi:CBS domain-containing protein
LAQAANSFGVPLTVLGRLPRGTIDVKKSGLAPIVLLARLYGLVSGSPAIGTRDRLEAAAAHGTLTPRLAGRLDFAYTLCTRLRLHSQLRQIATGSELSDTITIDDIPWQDQGLLRNALRSVRSAQGTTAMTYRTDL